MELELVTEGHFDAAHFLPHYKGKCHNLHGHTWKYKLWCKGKVTKDGFVVDFNIFKELDHKNLNDIIKNPTAENICLYLVKKIKAYNPTIQIFQLRIYESPFEFVEYSDKMEVKM